MKVKLIHLLFVFALCLVPGLNAQESWEPPRNGNEFLERCKPVLDGPHDHRWAWCVGYAVGNFEALSIIACPSQQPASRTQAEEVNLETWVCVPNEGFTGTQLLRIVIKYLEESPKLLNSRPSYLLTDAFQLAFPCPRAVKAKRIR